MIFLKCSISKVAVRVISLRKQMFRLRRVNLPFCGLNTGFEVVEWLDKPAAASSLALIPLRSGEADSPAFGMLVLASPDSQRFRADMGTEFLLRFGEIASAALQRLR